jgi:hypothetical protein
MQSFHLLWFCFNFELLPQKSFPAKYPPHAAPTKTAFPKIEIIMEGLNLSGSNNCGDRVAPNEANPPLANDLAKMLDNRVWVSEYMAQVWERKRKEYAPRD